MTPGSKLGPYEIVALIGAGGMGEVYRARDTKLDRDVALKVLPDAFARDPDRMARFEREAKVLASLNHPNIAHIYGVEERALVMELAEGESPKGPMPFEDAWKIATQIADALEYAHDKGVIHRDLKPANVKVTPEGVVKLLDFGLAKALVGDVAPASAGEDSPTLTMGPTVAGVILGTAAYMAPEQAKGKKVDKRADIWSFGVVLYELLTGERMFQGEDVVDTLAAVLHKQPDLERAPAQARKLLRRCLDKDPKQRLRDIGEARYLLETGGTEVPLQAKARATRLPWAVAGALAIAAAGFAALWLRPAPLPQVMRFEIHAPPGSSLPLGTPAISPDGRMLAFTVNDPDGMRRIHLRPIDRTETRALPGTEGAIHPFWSPDGRSLAFAADNPLRLRRIDVEGGAARDLLVNTLGPWHGTWNQNGDILVSGPRRILAEGGPATPAAAVDEAKGENGIGHPYFLPDGKRFLVLVNTGDKSSIQLATLGSMKRTLVLDNVESAPILAPTPQGKTYLLYLRESDLFGQEFDERSGALRGNPALVVSNVGRVANPAVRAAVGVSRAGILAYQTGGESQAGQLTWFDRSGKQTGSLPADASGITPEISPDGSSVAVLRRNASGGQNVWVTDLARKSASRLTFSAVDLSPVWSPDGKRVAFVTLTPGKDGGVHVVDTGDRSKSQLIDKATLGPTSWSPDGKYLLAGSRFGALTLLPLAADGKPLRVGSRNGRSGQGRISPDGKFAAFGSDESGQFEVYLQQMPPAVGQWKVSINGGQAPRWRRDGKELFFVAPDDSIMAVDIGSGPNPAGVPHALFRAKGADRADLMNYDVRGDGQQFLIFMVGRETQDAAITVVVNWWAELRP